MLRNTGLPLILAATALLAPLIAAQEMSYEQLLSRPELWPLECRVVESATGNGTLFEKGTVLRVMHLQPDGVVFEVEGGEAPQGLPAEFTDILQVAARECDKLSPEQLELTYDKLAERPELWPDKIRLQRSLMLGKGDDHIVLPRGTEYVFGCLDGDTLRVTFAEYDQEAVIHAFATDLMQQARARLANPPTEPPTSRVLRALEGKLIDLDRKGRKARLSKSRPPRYILLYFSAGWCGPCRNFSPDLVSFYEKTKGAGKTFEVIFISRDHSENEMTAYAKEEDFPWLAVSFDKLGEIPLVQAYGQRGVPHLLVLDTAGRVLADSYRKTKYLGADTALARFREILDSDSRSGRRSKCARP